MHSRPRILKSVEVPFDCQHMGLSTPVPQVVCFTSFIQEYDRGSDRHRKLGDDPIIAAPRSLCAVISSSSGKRRSSASSACQSQP